MLGRFALDFGRSRERVLTAGKVAFAVSLLAGCSSIPDSVNPVAWFGSKDEPAVATPVPAKGAETAKTADTSRDLAKGLPADKGNSKYAEPVRREVAPTKPLARRAPAPTDTQVAAAPEAKVPPKPAVTTQELPPPPAAASTQGTQVAQADTSKLSLDRRAPQARDDGPSAPPASVNMVPPPPANVPENVPVAGRGRGKPLQDQFQRRLAESAQQTVTPGMVDMPRPALASAYGAEEEPIHLVPPTAGKRSHKGGGKGMAAPAPEPAASFQVAALDFRANSSDLTAADRTSVAEVARLYRQTGGVVRVVGYAPTLAAGGDAVNQMMDGLEASMKRANAVARELTKRGVPAGKIMVGADPAAGMGNAGAQVYIDVI